MKRKWAALVSGASATVLVVAATVAGGGGERSGLALSIETIKPGVTCPVNADNGAYKLDRWKVGAQLTYTKYTAGFPAGASTAIDNAFTTWEVETELADVFGAETASGSGTVAFDNVNAVFFRPLGGNTIATTYVWYNRGTRDVVEFDMVFNSNLTWGTLSGSGDCVDSNDFDVEDIAAHEIGHVVGVAHTSPNGANNAQSLYPYGQAGEIYKRSLGDGDKAGANAKY